MTCDIRATVLKLFGALGHLFFGNRAIQGGIIQHDYTKLYFVHFAHLYFCSCMSNRTVPKQTSSNHPRAKKVYFSTVQHVHTSQTKCTLVQHNTSTLVKQSVLQVSNVHGRGMDGIV